MDRLAGSLEEILVQILGLLFLSAPWILVAYLFRLRPGSARDRLIADVIRVVSLAFLAVLFYGVGSTPGCTGCAFALVGLLVVGGLTTVAGIRIAGDWRNPFFVVVALLGALGAGIWVFTEVAPFWQNTDPGPLEIIWAVIMGTAGALGGFTVFTTVWPIVRLLAIPLRAVRRRVGMGR